MRAYRPHHRARSTVPVLHCITAVAAHRSPQRRSCSSNKSVNTPIQPCPSLHAAQSITTSSSGKLSRVVMQNRRPAHAPLCNALIPVLCRLAHHSTSRSSTTDVSPRHAFSRTYSCVEKLHSIRIRASAVPVSAVTLVSPGPGDKRRPQMVTGRRSLRFVGWVCLSLLASME